jgi:hypothetical protein
VARIGSRTLFAAIVGATLVWGMFWVEESVLPEVISLPLAVGRLLMLATVLPAAWLVARRWPSLVAASILAGAGLGWALHEIDPLRMCQSDMLYRPCTTSEIGFMVVPAIVFVLLAGAIAAGALREKRRTRPA